jgi:serine/threonine-protein kinase
LRICAEVASALAAAHARGLVHRDVKPSNIMLTPSGAKVVDFGLAAVAGQAELDDDGELHGTPAYLAPERLTGGEVIPASDVYALGLLLHRALTNHLPWQAETTTQMLNAHVYVEPAPLPPTSGVLPEVNRLCDRCLSKDPADRPSAAEVAAALADAAGIVLMPQDDHSDPALPTPRDGVAHDSTFRPEGVAAAVTAGEGHAPGRGRRRRSAVLLTGLVSAVVATVVTIALGGVLDRYNAQPAVGGAAALPGSAALPSSGAGTALPGPAGPGASVDPPDPAGPTTAGPAAAPPPSTAGPGPGPAPTSRAASPTPAQPGAPVSAHGGVARVRCDDKQARILRLDVAAGYTVDEYRPGPAKEVKAVLISAANKSEIKAKCEGDAVAAETKESPLRPG